MFLIAFHRALRMDDLLPDQGGCEAGLRHDGYLINPNSSTSGCAAVNLTGPFLSFNWLGFTLQVLIASRTGVW
jgi:hypothetical protein